MNAQADLFATRRPDTPTPRYPGASDSDFLRSHLDTYAAWRTRAEICASLGWTERRLRLAAEALGSHVLRSQAGFKLSTYITRDDLPLVQASADAFISQGKKMIRYGIAIRKLLHAIIG